MCKECGCGQATHIHQQVLKVPGMMCSNCENTVKSAVLGLSGVNSVDVNLTTKDVTVAFDANEVTVNAIAKAIDDTGFEVTEIGEPAHAHGGIIGKLKGLFK